MLPVAPEVEDVALTALSALNGYNSSCRMTKAERRKAGRKIASLAHQLNHELLALSDPHKDVWDLPVEFRSELYRSQSEAFKKITIVPVNGYSEFEGGFTFGFIGFMDAVAAIERGALEFAESRPPIAKPHKPTAARQFFIQVFTDHFCDVYGTPLRDSTLAIASVFFDCSDLDRSAIAQLAPRRSRTPT